MACFYRTSRRDNNRQEESPRHSSSTQNSNHSSPRSRTDVPPQRTRDYPFRGEDPAAGGADQDVSDTWTIHSDEEDDFLAGPLPSTRRSASPAHGERAAMNDNPRQHQYSRSEYCNWPHTTYQPPPTMPSCSSRSRDYPHCRHSSLHGGSNRGYEEESARNPSQRSFRSRRSFLDSLDESVERLAQDLREERIARHLVNCPYSSQYQVSIDHEVCHRSHRCRYSSSLGQGELYSHPGEHLYPRTARRSPSTPPRNRSSSRTTYEPPTPQPHIPQGRSCEPREFPSPRGPRPPFRDFGDFDYLPPRHIRIPRPTHRSSRVNRDHDRYGATSRRTWDDEGLE